MSPIQRAVRTMIRATLLGLGLVGAPLAAQLTPDRPVHVDHVVIAVRDLDVAGASFREMGFVLEDGRLHPNGLLNRHLEFQDGTEIELMSVGEQPGDDIARGYAQFLDQHGEGGAFLALRGTQAAVLAAASRANVEANAFDSGGFGYVTFPSPGLAALFVVEYPSESGDSTPPASHGNGAIGISSVWVEGPEALIDLLVAMGADPNGDEMIPDGRSGTALELDGTTIVVTPSMGTRPRVVGMELESTSPTSISWPPSEAHGIWLNLRGTGR